MREFGAPFSCLLLVLVLPNPLVPLIDDGSCCTCCSNGIAAFSKINCAILEWAGIVTGVVD
jgi:hypothetical protein